MKKLTKTTAFTDCSYWF